ncbi:MAG: histidine phosphatase family protein [Clostridia bacterium]|nr:histidine phosphatase family protein [Clostridia bacterium]
MIFYYIRHGEPIYDPDSLTELGTKQAKALAKRLAIYGVDKIFTSSSNRAIETAQPTCELLNIEAECLEFAHENLTWEDLSVEEDGKRTWIFNSQKYKELFCGKEIRDLGDRWYEHPELKGINCEKGINRIYDEADKFFASLGYEHERYTGKYKVTKSNDQRVALFAHQGFGLAFLSCLLDVPYPMFSTHFNVGHSGLTVIEFKEANGVAIPRMHTMSSDAHIYHEGLPLNYNNYIKF